MQYAFEMGSSCNFQVSQGSVEAYLRKIFTMCVQNFLGNLIVKEFCKSVYICGNYYQKSRTVSFLRHSV